MAKKECDCQTAATKVVDGKRLNTAALVRGVMAVLFIASIGSGLLKLSLPFYIPSLSVLVSLVVLVVSVRTLFVGTCCFPSTQIGSEELRRLQATTDASVETEIFARESEMIKRLSGALQIPTVSYDKTDSVNTTDLSQFVKLKDFLAASYPLLHKTLSLEVINGYSLLYKWQGSNDTLKPYLVTAHMDVVPVTDNEDWTQDSFSGHIDDEFVWGRGAIDDKQNVLGYMEAITFLLERGTVPQRTVYIAFGHDEETTGEYGARMVAAHQIDTLGKDCMEFMMDEGLFIIDGAVPGHKKPVAMVCIAEKGAVTIRQKCVADAGHSSTPKQENAIDIIAQAVHKIHSNPMPAHTDPALPMLESLLDGYTLPLRAVFSNTWLFAPLLKIVLTFKHTTAAILRTTAALTVFNAGSKDNVLPNVATAIVNHRIHPNDSIASVLAWDKKIINDTRVSIDVLHSIDPAPVSDSNHPAFRDITTAIHRVFKGSCSIAPGIFIANSDSRHYWNVTPQIFRFSPLVLNQDEIKMFHGTNERIRIRAYTKQVLFYVNQLELTDKRAISM